MKESLTSTERQAIRVLNFVARYDGLFQSESDISYLLSRGIEEFISPKRRHLVDIPEPRYPLRIERKNSK